METNGASFDFYVGVISYDVNGEERYTLARSESNFIILDNDVYVVRENLRERFEQLLEYYIKDLGYSILSVDYDNLTFIVQDRHYTIKCKFSIEWADLTLLS